MSAANDPRHTLLDLPMGGPYLLGRYSARLAWQPMIRRFGDDEPQFFIHGSEDYEPARRKPTPPAPQRSARQRRPERPTTITAAWANTVGATA